MTDPGLIWIALAAGAALVLPAALWLLTASGRADAARKLQRMRGVAPAPDTAQRILLEVSENDGRRKPPFLRSIDQMLAALQAPLGGRTFLLLTGALAFLMGALAVKLSGSLLIGAAIFSAVGFAPVAILRARFARHVEAFAAQLPDALELMTRGLRIGHPISATISNVARTMADPIGAEFRVIEQKIGHGDYLTDAFSDLADKMQQEDMHYLAVSIRIQHGTGGNLADMLTTLSKVIRSRILLRRRVRALSSEGRMSSLLLSSLPVVIYGATTLMAPDYYGAVQDHPMFLPIAAAIIALVVANFLVLRRLVNFQA
ncbi:type II secretion system F family protein [Thalassococcus sp. BH17M4-6]|uniref:type II secretion system F family protein n=1 Tax=Thalassococcus sp. BH17M4-6 TaxID=3413148 RepID=UPI003BE2CF93